MSLSKLVMSSLTGTLKALTTRITILYFLEERLDFIFFLSFLCGFNCLLGINSSKKVDFKALIKMKEKIKLIEVPQITLYLEYIPKQQFQKEEEELFQN